MTTVLSEIKKYIKPGDVIEYSKKYEAYEFYGIIDFGQADRWIKIIEKAFNILQLPKEEGINNVYRLLFVKADNVYILLFVKADNWLTRIRNL